MRSGSIATPLFHACWLEGKFFLPHLQPFLRRASANGILLKEEFLPYFQLDPVPLARPSFLQGLLCKAYSVVRRL